MNWFEKFIAVRLFKWAVGKLDGYKSYIGGASIIFGGIGIALMGIQDGDYVEMSGGVIAVGKGLETIGAAHKMEKQTAALLEAAKK